MKKTIIALLALAGAAAAETLLEMDFTKLSGYSSDCEINNVTYTSVLPEGWATGQWNGDNPPHYQFGTNGATVREGWKQNYLWTSTALSSSANVEITFTLYNGGTEDTGNMFFLSSDNYSIVIGNSYNSNSEIYVGTWGASIPDGNTFVNFQKDNMPIVVDNSSGFDVQGDISYTLLMSGGNLTVKAACSSGSTWTTTVEGMSDVTFSSLGFISDGAVGTAGVKNITVASVPEPTAATLSLLALAGLAVRRRRR